MFHQFPDKQHRSNSEQYFCNQKKSKLTFIQQLSTDLLKRKAAFSYSFFNSIKNRIGLHVISKTSINFKVFHQKHKKQRRVNAKLLQEQKYIHCFRECRDGPVPFSASGNFTTDSRESTAKLVIF